MLRIKRLGIKKIPELKHHKGGEKHRQLVCVDANRPRISKINQQCKQQNKEKDTAKGDTLCHRRRDNGFGLLAWFFVHYLARRR